MSQGQTGTTIENKLSHLRAFCEWIGKTNLIRTLGEYVDREANNLVRTYVTTADKSWEGNGVDAAQKIAEIAVEHPRVAVQLKLQAAFGLRIEESFSLKIAEALRNVDTLRVKDGTKGGRERNVPVQLRLAVLEEAAEFIDPLRGSTTPANYSIKRWRDHYNTVLRKYGIYKEGAGCDQSWLAASMAARVLPVIDGIGRAGQGWGSSRSGDLQAVDPASGRSSGAQQGVEVWRVPFDILGNGKNRTQAGLPSGGAHQRPEIGCRHCHPIRRMCADYRDKQHCANHPVPEHFRTLFLWLLRGMI